MSQKKQLQRLRLAEDERKLQTKRFVKQCVWKPKGGNHRLMKSGYKKGEAVSTEKSGLFVFIGIVLIAQNRRHLKDGACF